MCTRTINRTQIHFMHVIYTVIGNVYIDWILFNLLISSFVIFHTIYCLYQLCQSFRYSLHKRSVSRFIFDDLNSLPTTIYHIDWLYRGHPNQYQRWMIGSSKRSHQKRWLCPVRSTVRDSTCFKTTKRFCCPDQTNGDCNKRFTTSTNCTRIHILSIPSEQVRILLIMK